MKTQTFLTAVVMFSAFSVVALAQATFTIGSIPVTAVVASGLTERTGDISFTTIGSMQVQTGVITIDYGVPVTLIGNVCQPGAPCVAPAGVALSPFNPSNPSQIQLAITGPIAPPLYFDIRGVRVAVAGSGLTSLSAHVWATGNAIEVGGNNNIPIIYNILPGIGSFTATNAAEFNSIFGGGCQTVDLNVRENFFNAFGVTNTTDPSQNVSKMIRFTVSAIPDGLTLSFPATAGAFFSRTDAAGTITGAPLVLPDLAGTNTIYYRVTMDTNPTLIDTLSIPVEICGEPPITIGSVTAVATFAPVSILAGTLIPRYINAPVGPVTMVTVVPGATTLDFDGDGIKDIAVWRPSIGVWYVLLSGTPGSYTERQWGVETDIPTPGDYDGDGKTDIAVWRPGPGIWYILPSDSSPGIFWATQWGLPTDTPFPGDFDGDGKMDIAVWRSGSGTWYILPSDSSPGTFWMTQWGLPTDAPVSADYDGDGETDIAVWRPSDGVWYIIPSNSPPGTYTAIQWGLPTDKPVPCDYDGDVKADIAVWRPSEGIWYILPSNSPPGTFLTTQWGVSTDIPAPGDYDGDGKTDIAVWRPSDGVWYGLPSNLSELFWMTQWGVSTDVSISSVTGILRALPCCGD
jgi:hypothetical protein